MLDSDTGELSERRFDLLVLESDSQGLLDATARELSTAWPRQERASTPDRAHSPTANS